MIEGFLSQIVSHNHLGRGIYQLSPPREHPVSSISVGDINLLLVLRVRNKKFAYIFEGNKITTQSKRSTSSDRYLNFLRQPIAGSASTSRLAQLAAWTPPELCARALRSLSCRCCRVFQSFRLVSSTNTQKHCFPASKI